MALIDTTKEFRLGSGTPEKIDVPAFSSVFCYIVNHSCRVDLGSLFELCGER